VQIQLSDLQDITTNQQQLCRKRSFIFYSVIAMQGGPYGKRFTRKSMQKSAAIPRQGLSGRVEQ